MKLDIASLLIILSVKSVVAQDILVTTLSILPTESVDLSTALPTDVANINLSGISLALPTNSLLPDLLGSGETSSTTDQVTMTLSATTSAPAASISAGNSFSALGMPSNTAFGSGSSPTPVPDPNGGSAVGAQGLGANGNNGTIGNANIGAANANSTSGNNTTSGSGIAPTSNMGGSIPSMSPSSLYTAIISQQISLAAILSVITSLSPQQIQSVQNAVAAQQASLQTCYAPVVCLTNPSNPGQLSGGTLVVSTLNGQSTTFQIPAGGATSGTANYVVTSSGAGTLANAAAAVQSMSALPKSSGATAQRLGLGLFVLATTIKFL